MWKLIGISSASQTSQKGRQSGWAKSGIPESWGLEHITIPLAPSPCIRSTSATQASMSHHGTSAIGRMRPPDCRCRSFIQSL
jgi:hypothetical protein